MPLVFRTDSQQRPEGSSGEPAKEAPAGVERQIPRHSLENNRRQTMSNATDMATEPGVGSRKLFENDKIIVWDFVLPVGAETPVHTHVHSYMWFAVQGAPLQIYDEHGTSYLLEVCHEIRRLHCSEVRIDPSSTSTIPADALIGFGDRNRPKLLVAYLLVALILGTALPRIYVNLVSNISVISTGQDG